MYARTRSGQMVPLESVIDVKETTAPQVIGHFNLFRSATLNGSAAPGVSSGDALREMETLAARTLPAGMTTAWSGISLEETKAGSQTIAGVARQPETQSRLFTIMFLTVGLVEAAYFINLAFAALFIFSLANQ